MNERLKKLRKTLDMTQQEFADKLHIKRGTIATYEIGRNIPIDAVISLICREFNVNEEWLRTGNGEMFLPRSRNQIIADFAENLINESDSFKKRLFEGLALLDEKEWEYLEKIAIKLSAKERSYFSVPETPEELEEKYSPMDIKEIKKNIERDIKSDVG